MRYTSDTPFEIAEAVSKIDSQPEGTRKLYVAKTAAIERVSTATTQAGSNPSAHPQNGVRVRRKNDKENQVPVDSSQQLNSLRSSELDDLISDASFGVNHLQKTFSSNLQAKYTKLFGAPAKKNANDPPESIKPLMKSKTVLLDASKERD